VWCEDEAGPYQAIPQPGTSWRPEGQPSHQPHEYLRGGTAKLLTLFHPASGAVRARPAEHTPNSVLHPWLQEELTAILTTLPPLSAACAAERTVRSAWSQWQAGLSQPHTLPAELPPLRVLLVLDNLAGHKSGDFVRWLFAHGIMPLYTPLGGSWLNLAEPVQRIIVRRALLGHHPDTSAELMDWLDATVRGWNAHPTPFVWGGKRAARRHRAQGRRHALGGAGGYTCRPIPRSRSRAAYGGLLRLGQVTH